MASLLGARTLLGAPGIATNGAIGRVDVGDDVYVSGGE